MGNLLILKQMKVMYHYATVNTHENVPWRLKVWSEGRFPIDGGRDLSLLFWTFKT